MTPEGWARLKKVVTDTEKQVATQTTSSSTTRSQIRRAAAIAAVKASDADEKMSALTIGALVVAGGAVLYFLLGKKGRR